MHAPTAQAAIRHEPWYKYGVTVLFLEMAIAISVCAYALYLSFHGLAGPHGGV